MQHDEEALASDCKDALLDNRKPIVDGNAKARTKLGKTIGIFALLASAFLVVAALSSSNHDSSQSLIDSLKSNLLYRTETFFDGPIIDGELVFAKSVLLVSARRYEGVFFGRLGGLLGGRKSREGIT